MALGRKRNHANCRKEDRTPAFTRLQPQIASCVKSLQALTMARYEAKTV